MKNTRRILTILLIVLSVILAGTIGWIVYDMNVDRSGFLVQDGIYYYQDFHARLVTGWQDIDGSRYYFGEDNAMATYWQDIDGKRYYFSGDGTLDTGWVNYEEEYYYMGTDGVMLSGWQDIEESRYHFDTDGSMDTGWLEEADKRYYFGEDGKMTLGFLVDQEEVYYFDEEGAMVTGYMMLEESVYLFEEDGTMHTGWLEEEDGRRYFAQNGPMVTGWLKLDEGRYYLDEDGLMQTGWLELGEYDYYLQESGIASVGPTDIDGRTYYFTPAGIHVVLVNYRHSVPDDYEPDLVTYEGWHRVDSVCLEALKTMLADCNAAGISFTFNSAYRSYYDQVGILDSRTQEYMAAYEMEYGAARAKALQSVAVPGTSEHHLGLAVDIIGKEAQAWLAEHCWKYGFILRYTGDKAHITGIIDEPWHFRYVGTEVSLDMQYSGLCLEEYLGES